MVDVMQKSVLVPYEKYLRLLSLQENKNIEKSADITNKPTEISQSENVTKTQTHDVRDEGLILTDETLKPEYPEDESLEPLIPEKKSTPIPKKTFKNKSLRYKLHKTWIRF